MKRSTVVIGVAVAPVIALFVSIGVVFGTPGSTRSACTQRVAQLVARPSRSYWGRRRPSLSRGPSA